MEWLSAMPPKADVPKVDDFSEIISERLSDQHQWSGFLLRRLAAAWF